jgi:hypothetical protein
MELIGLLLAGIPSPSPADWAGFSSYGAIAEMAIKPDEIKLHLRIRQSFIPRFARLLGSESDHIAIEALASRMIRLREEHGRFLEGQMKTSPRLEPANGSPDGGNTPMEAFYETELHYPLPQRSQTLSFVPPEGIGKDLGLIVLHQGVPTADLLPLETPTQLTLNWNDPWRSRFANPEFVRRHSEPRSFVYVEAYEVRHELLLRLTDLKPWLKHNLKNPRFIEAQEWEPLKRNIGTLLQNRNPFRIDGITATPQLDRIDFVRCTRSGLEIIHEPTPLETTTALLGVILVYPTERPVRTIELEWDLFGGRDEQRSVSLYFGQESFDSYVTVRKPRFEWMADEAFDLPQEATTASISPPGDIASAKMGLDEELAKRILQGLLHNTYRAFQLRNEEAAYDRLALGLAGELLDEVYLQQRRTILQRDQGVGGESRVDRVEVLVSKIHQFIAESNEYEIDARWLAQGSISHFGHSHPKNNLYRARLSLRSDQSGVWKITAMAFPESEQKMAEAAL